MTERLIKILLVDEYTLARQGVAMLLSRHPAVELVGQADLSEAVSAAERLRPDAVIVEPGMSYTGAREVLARLLEVEPRPVVVVLTRFADARIGEELLRRGAGAYVSKTARFESLLPALFDALGGKKVVVGVAEEPLETHGDGPTQRELEILTLAAQGKSNREIAEVLYLSEATVKRHLANFYSRMGVHSRAEAVRKALSEGWISEHDIS